jgi:hypothetical protein
MITASELSPQNGRGLWLINSAISIIGRFPTDIRRNIVSFLSFEDVLIQDINRAFLQTAMRTNIRIEIEQFYLLASKRFSIPITDSTQETVIELIERFALPTPEEAVDIRASLHELQEVLWQPLVGMNKSESISLAKTVFPKCTYLRNEWLQRAISFPGNPEYDEIISESLNEKPPNLKFAVANLPFTTSSRVQGLFIEKIVDKCLSQEPPEIDIGMAAANLVSREEEEAGDVKTKCLEEIVKAYKKQPKYDLEKLLEIINMIPKKRIKEGLLSQIKQLQSKEPKSVRIEVASEIPSESSAPRDMDRWQQAIPLPHQPSPVSQALSDPQALRSSSLHRDTQRAAAVEEEASRLAELLNFGASLIKGDVAGVKQFASRHEWYRALRSKDRDIASIFPDALLKSSLKKYSIEEIYTFSTRISDEKVKSFILIRIVLVCLQKNPPDFSLAKQAASAILSETDQSAALYEIFRAYLLQNPPSFELARQIALSIPDRQNQFAALTNLTKTYLEQNPPNFYMARQIALLVPGKPNHMYIFDKPHLIPVVTGIDPFWRKLEALSISGKTFQIYTLKDIVQDYLQKRPPNFDLAIQAARTISNKMGRSAALCEIVKAYLQPNPPNFDLARQVALTISDKMNRFSALNKIVKAYLLQNPPNFDSARQLALTIPDETSLSSALTEIAKAYVWQNPPNLDRARQEALTIPDEMQQSSALSTIAKAYLRQNPPSFDRARQEALTIPDETMRSSVLNEIVEVCLRQNPPDFNMGWQIALIISNWRDQSSALNRIVEAYLQQDPPNFDRAHQVALALPGELSKSSTLKKIAQVASRYRPSKVRYNLLEKSSEPSSSTRPRYSPKSLVCIPL